MIIKKTFASGFVFLVLCLFSFLITGVHAQTMSAYELKQAEKTFTDKHATKDAYLHFYNDLTEAHKLNSSNPDSAKIIYIKILADLKSANLAALYDRVLIDYAFQLVRTGNPDEALKSIAEVENSVAATHDAYLVFFLRRIKNQAFKIQGNLKEALEQALSAKEILANGIEIETDETKKTWMQLALVNIQSDIANLFKDTKQIEKSLTVQKDNLKKINEWDEEFLSKIEKKISDKDLYLANAYNNLALTHISEMKEGDKPNPVVENYLNQAIELDLKINHLVFLSRAYYNYSNYWGNIKNLLRQNEYLTKALSINEQINDETGIIICQSELADNLMKQGKDPERALALAQGALNVVREIPEFGQKSGIYRIYCDALAANNKIDLLLTYVDSVYYYNETELKNTFDNEITEMQTKYETVEKEKEIIKQQGEIEKRRAQLNLQYGGLAALLIIALLIFRSYLNKKKANVIIQKERDRSDNLLLNILPAETAEELKLHGKTEARQYDDCTILFTDFKDFTKLAEVLSPQELVGEIDFCFQAFDRIISKYNIEKIKTIGDAYMCASGVPVINHNHATDTVNAALDIRDFMDTLYAERKLKNKHCFRIRVGVHSGQLVAGVVGIKKFAYDVWGDAVNIASRMESSGETGKVNVSGSTFDLIKNNFHMQYRGKIEAKNKGEVDMYFAERLSYENKNQVVAADLIL